MKVGEHDLALADQTVFLRKGLFHLHDHVRAVIHLLRSGHNFGTRLFVELIGKSTSQSCTGLHQHLMTVRFQQLHSNRKK